MKINQFIGRLYPIIGRPHPAISSKAYYENPPYEERKQLGQTLRTTNNNTSSVQISNKALKARLAARKFNYNLANAPKFTDLGELFGYAKRQYQFAQQKKGYLMPLGFHVPLVMIFTDLCKSTFLSKNFGEEGSKFVGKITSTHYGMIRETAKKLGVEAIIDDLGDGCISLSIPQIIPRLIAVEKAESAKFRKHLEQFASGLPEGQTRDILFNRDVLRGVRFCLATPEELMENENSIHPLIGFCKFTQCFQIPSLEFFKKYSLDTNPHIIKIAGQQKQREPRYFFGVKSFDKLEARAKNEQTASEFVPSGDVEPLEIQNINESNCYNELIKISDQDPDIHTISIIVNPDIYNQNPAESLSILEGISGLANPLIKNAPPITVEELLVKLFLPLKKGKLDTDAVARAVHIVQFMDYIHLAPNSLLFMCRARNNDDKRNLEQLEKYLQGLGKKVFYAGFGPPGDKVHFACFFNKAKEEKDKLTEIDAYHGINGKPGHSYYDNAQYIKEQIKIHNGRILK